MSTPPSAELLAQIAALTGSLAQSKAAAEGSKADVERSKAAAEGSKADAEQLRVELKRATLGSTLMEFLDLCHTQLFLELQIEQNKTLTTQGGPTNVTGKHRPRQLRHWSNLVHEQGQALLKVQSLYPNDARSFDGPIMIQGRRATLKHTLASEYQVGVFSHNAVERPVETILSELQAHGLGHELGLGAGGIFFQENTNGLSQDMPATTPRRDPDHAPKPVPDQFLLCAPDADQPGRREALVVIEYMAAHKLSLDNLRAGLQDLDLGHFLADPSIPSPEDTSGWFIYQSTRIVAAAITQLFDYLLDMGLEYGYLSTAQAYVFVRVDWDEPGIIYYHLSDPKAEVAVQVLAYCLMAVRSTPRSNKDRMRLAGLVPTWQFDFEEMLRQIPTSERKLSSFNSAYAGLVASAVDRSPYLLCKRPVALSF